MFYEETMAEQKRFEDFFWGSFGCYYRSRESCFKSHRRRYAYARREVQLSWLTWINKPNEVQS